MMGHSRGNPWRYIQRKPQSRLFQYPNLERHLQLLKAFQTLACPSMPDEKMVTTGEFKLLCALDDDKILAERKSKQSSPGSFAAQEQYSPEQIIITSKLECLAELISRNNLEKNTHDRYLNLLGKLQNLLRVYIELKKTPSDELDLVKDAIDELSQDKLPEAQKMSMAEVKFIAALDEEKLLNTKNRRPPSPGSFAAQKQYTHSQEILTKKLSCLAELISRSNPRLIQEQYTALISKLTYLLARHIRNEAAKEESLKAGPNPAPAPYFG